MDETRAASLARDALADYEHANPEPIAQALREVWLRAVPARPIALSPGQQAFVRDWGIADPEFAAAGTPVPILTAMGKEIGRLLEVVREAQATGQIQTRAEALALAKEAAGAV